jgi:DnaA family protein
MPAGQKELQIPLPFVDGRAPVFDLFVPGPNAEAVQSVRTAVTGRGPNLYLWGPAGTGKTHLLLAACHDATIRERRSTYLPLHERSEWNVGMLEGLERFDLVCLDDIEAIAGDAQWEAGLFHLINRIRDGAARVIITGDAAPGDLALDLRDLSSRVGWELVLQIRTLDDEDKLAALKKRAAARGFDLPPEVGRYMLERLPRDMQALCAVFDRLDDASLTLQRKLTITLVRSLLVLPVEPRTADMINLGIQE